jgi:hypothetical protein
MGWFILGLTIGVPAGYFVAALMIVASDHDHRHGE